MKLVRQKSGNHQKKKRSVIIPALLFVIVSFGGAKILGSQMSHPTETGAQTLETSFYSDEITNTTERIENNLRIVTEHHDLARIPYITVYKYPLADPVTGAAVPAPQNVSGTDYYRVISTNADEDSGDEVCAIATGTSCLGYVDESVTGFSVCSAYHPSASTVTDVVGDGSVVYCNGAPQTGACSSRTNTCLACPTCSLGKTCSQSIGDLYREMYVTCAATAATGTDLCSAGLDDDDGSGDGILDLTASETTFDNTSVIIDGCTVAIDGTHSFTDLQVLRNGTLTQSPTGTGTINRTNITVSGVTVVGTGSAINMDAKGAAGGYHVDPGVSTTTVQVGAKSSHGGSGTLATNPADAYGDYWDPQYPGSGGTKADGNGGGYVSLNVNTLQLDGEISADGATIGGCGGSSGTGGSIKISASGELSGNGSLSANAGVCTNTISDGGGGRIAIFYTTSGGINTTAPEDEYAIQAVNLYTGASGSWHAGPGTLYIEDSNAVGLGTYNANEGRLLVRDIYFNSSNVLGAPLPASVKLYELEVDTSIVTMTPVDDADLTITNSLSLTNNSILTYTGMISLGAIKRLNIDATAASISIDATSKINAEGKGAIGGNKIDPLSSTTNAVAGSNIGHGGVPGTSTSSAYGDFWNPLYPGSGGTLSSFTGGGYINITVNDLFNDGLITASGLVTAGCGGSPGSGGGIKILATGNLTGSGTVSVDSGNCTNTSSEASGGRLAFFYTTDGGINSTPPDQLYVLNARAVDGNAVQSHAPSPGTVYVEDANAVALGTYLTGEGRLIIDNKGLNTGIATVARTGVPILGTVNLYELTVNSNSTVTAETLVVKNTITLTDSSKLRHEPMTSLGPIKRLEINSPDADLNIDSTSSINLQGLGAIGNQRINPALSTTNAVSGGTGTYAGVRTSGVVSEAYGDYRDPIYPGSGGAGAFSVSPGGGYVSIIVSDLSLSGIITSSASPGSCSTNQPGSGGGVKIIASGELTGNGAVEAKGSNCSNVATTGSGGGRIAFFYDSDPAGVATNNSPETIYTISTANINSAGGAGTIYIEDDNATNGHVNGEGNLIIDAATFTSTNTPLFTPQLTTPVTITDLYVTNAGRLLIDTPCSGTPALTVTGFIDLSGGGQIVNNQPGTCTVSTAALNLDPNLASGVQSQAYSYQILSSGGYAPKTFVCLDGLGGSPITCDAGAGLPSGVTMNSSGLVSGTPSNGGLFNFVVRVTDSDPGGAQQDEDTMSLFVNRAPNAPTLVSPIDASQVLTTTPTLSSLYSDPDTGDVGTTDYRVSSGSSADCVNNVSIVDFGTSAASASNNQATTYSVTTPLNHLSTYNWCARNNDGVLTSNGGTFTAQGSFTVNLGNPPNAPVLISPENASTTNLLSPILSASYSDSDGGDTGVTEYRVSSGSSANCLSNVNVVWSGSSPATVTNNEATQVTVGIALTNLSTYNWCARNNDGVLTSNSGNFTTMGSFLVDTSYSPGGSVGTILQNQLQQQSQQPTDPGTNPDTAPVVENDLERLNISVSVTGVNGNPLVRPTPLEKLLLVNITIENPTSVTAQNVLANMVLPKYLIYVPNSLRVNQAVQTDHADEDAGQASNTGIGATWASVNPGETKTVTLQLMFNRSALIARDTAAAANPLINLSADVSASNAADVFHSNVVVLEPDTSSFQAPEQPTEVDPEPAPIPEPTPEPSPEPTPEPTPTPSPTPTPEPSPAPSPTPNPTTNPSLSEQGQFGGQQGGGSIPLTPQDTQGQSSDLVLTGNATSEEEGIAFSGTVSEQNANIVVLINNSYAVTVKSDDNGFWQLFVNSEELGIEPGESATLVVEVFAQSKDGRQSNFVSQTIFVEREGEGEIAISPIDTSTSSTSFSEELSAFVGQAREAVRNEQETIQKTLSVTVPVVLVASAPLWGYLPFIPMMFFHFITWLLGLSRKKKSGKLYGTVYDSITKQPLSLAIVRVYKENKLVATEVTDKQGRYEFLLEPGNYRLEVKKPQYFFPSKIVDDAADGDYHHVYKAEQMLEISQHDLALPDVPMDPVNAKRRFQLANLFKKLWLALQSAGQHLAVPVLFVGALASIVTLIAAPENALNWVLALVYVLMFTLQLVFREHTEKPWGIVYELSSNAAVPLATIQLIDPEFGKVVKSRLSDYQGRYAFLPDPGSYVIHASKDGYVQAASDEGKRNGAKLSEKINIKKEGDRVSGDVPMKLQ